MSTRSRSVRLWSTRFGAKEYRAACSTPVRPNRLRLTRELPTNASTSQFLQKLHSGDFQMRSHDLNQQQLTTKVVSAMMNVASQLLGSAPIPVASRKLLVRRVVFQTA